ncbi:MAG: hypothetical protein ACEQSX_12525 [Baekduiaceae bacterium]
MPDLDTLFPGRFVKGRALEGPLLIRVVGIVGEPLEGDDGKKQLKGILRYRSWPDGTTMVPGEMILNKTNALLAAAIFGTRDYTAWAGKLLVIAFDPTVKLGAETPGGIRVVGSPDLKAPLRVEVKRPRRSKPDVYVLQPTDNRGQPRTARKAETKPDQTPPPNPEPATEPRDPGAEG